MLRNTVAALVLTTILASPAMSDDDGGRMNRTLSLSGHGEVRVAPDMATLNLGVATHADTAKDAVAANSTAMKSLLDALKSAGVQDKDIQTSNFSVSPRYDYGREGNEAPKPNGFDAANNVTVTVRKIDDVGMVLDAAVKAGSNQIYGVAFGLTDPEPVQDEARKKAVADARRKAQLYASAAGVTLDSIVSLTESGGYQPPEPRMYRAAADARAADVPIAQGEQVVAADVAVSWTLK